MSVTKSEVEKLAMLARLKFSDAELDQFVGEFDEIIAFADTINQSVEGGTGEIRSVDTRSIPSDELRTDEVTPSLPNEKIVSNVGEVNGFFTVKRSQYERSHS
jgi:aspartyl-tRNA(Asn)/glutamyl-tRNA(Gln) amidotransferase subunit C